MATSIIDYIFRELAITYLERYDLAQVEAEDLRPDAVRQPGAGLTAEGAEGTTPPPGPPSTGPSASSGQRSGRRLSQGERGRAAPTPPSPARRGEGAASPAFRVPPSEHLRVPVGNGNGGAAKVGNGHGHGAAPGRGLGIALVQGDAVRQARLKGYEGDPCGECGQLTMVRSGTCLRCDTCGATSGCS